MALFGNKKDEIPPMGSEGGMQGEMPPPYEMDQNSMGDLSSIPIDSVLALRQQGLTNNQIVQSLQRDGYTSDQIFEAINQADIKGNVESVPQGQLDQMAPLDNPMPQQYDQYPQYPQQPQRGYQQPMMGSTDQIEEIAEAIISEKWEELSRNISKVVEWKDKTESKINKIEQSIEDLRVSFDKLQSALVGKISEYDKNIINVGTEIKAMEKVFQKILPTFTENVNELSRMTRKIKKTPSKKH
ncbi:MAG: hypothetical protein ABII01_04865 [Candidatus Woesearchaeota archaeon]